jgi:hypothetical protein
MAGRGVLRGSGLSFRCRRDTRIYGVTNRSFVIGSGCWVLLTMLPEGSVCDCVSQVARGSLSRQSGVPSSCQHTQQQRTKLEDTMRCCRADSAETPAHELQGRSQAMLCKRSTTPLIGTPSERHCYTYCGDKSLGSNHTMNDEQHPNPAGDSARSYAVTDA